MGVCVSQPEDTEVRAHKEAEKLLKDVGLKPFQSGESIANCIQ